MTTVQTFPARSRWPYAASGVIAAVAGTAAAHLAAGAVNPAASPVLAVGSAVVDATPTPVKEWAVATFGTADKPILLGSVTVVTLLAAAGIGLVARRRRTLGLVLLVGLTALAGAAALGQPASGQVDVLPALVAAAVGLAVLAWLTGLADRASGDGATSSARPKEAAAPAGPAAATAPADPAALGEPAGTPGPQGNPGTPGRRTFLVAAAGATAAAAVAGALGQKLANTTVPTDVALPAPLARLAALPTGLEEQVPGLSPFRTPIRSFYRIDTSLVLPRVDHRDWSLEVDGDVERPFRLTYDELLALPMIERDVTLTCVSNEVGGGYVSSARWLGVRVRDLLERAGVRDGVDQVLSTSTTGFTISTPLQALTDDRDALVAVGMNGQPLPVRHGFPARLVTPGLYGFVGCTKWLARLTATTYREDQAYWTERDWATDAPILTQSRIDTPGGLQTVRAGEPVTIGGVAWAQRRGITGVEVQVDDGPWLKATLGPEAGVDYWRQWYLRWTPEPGASRRTLTVRATDGSGETQTSEEATPFPRGATGWHSVVVLVEES